MPVNEMLTLAFSLAMDSFAVSLIFGTRDSLLSNRQAFAVAVVFALVQGGFISAAMLLGASFHSAIAGCDHWVAFGLLTLVAVHMLKEGKTRIYATKTMAGASILAGQKNAPANAQMNAPANAQVNSQAINDSAELEELKDEPQEQNEVLKHLGKIQSGSLLPASLLAILGLAVATSIDSLGAGIGISLMGYAGWLLPLIVGAVTFVFCYVGALLGRRVRSVQRMGGYACVVGGMLLLSMGLEILYDHGVF